MIETFTQTIAADALTPVRAYAAMRHRNAGMSNFLFESVTPGERWGRYSILGYRPEGETILPQGHDAIGSLHDGLPKPDPSWNVAQRFVRSAVGFVAYDAANHLQKVKPWRDEVFYGRALLTPTIAVFDHVLQTIQVAGPTEDSVKRCIWEMNHGPEIEPLRLPDPKAQPETLRVSMSDELYGAKVKRAKDYIAAGDAFQVVLARTFRGPLDGADPFDVYRALRVLSPAPYLFYIDFCSLPFGVEGLQIVGASPETLVRVEKGRVTLRPIAGTRPRGASDEEDARLADELLKDEKERAEHVMLIDLARNDVGRVAKPGTVEVTKTMGVEKYSHVMHIVSEVTGEVNDGLSVADVANAAFPAGTLTGAPKKRAMEIIRELEPATRFLYGGAVGWVAHDAVDFAIAIRAAYVANGEFAVTAGAGIVHDSDPQKEADETRNKARAILAAIRAAQDLDAEKKRREAAIAARKAKQAEEAAKAEAEAKANEGDATTGGGATGEMK